MSVDLELRQLRVFVAVVEAETLTRAAQVLGVAQSTVSERIAALERALGARVFRKSGRTHGLTDEGRALLPFAQKMLLLERETRAGLAVVGERANSTLIIGTVESVSGYLLPPIMSALQQTWQRLRIDVETGSCAEVRRRVKDGQIDLGLVIEPEGRQGSDETVLLRTPLVVFHAPRAGAAVAPTDEALRKGTFFLSDRAGSYHQLVREHFRAAGFPTPVMNGLGTIEAVKRTVSRTADAYGVLPQFALAEELQTEELSAVALRPPLGQLELKALRANRRQPLPPVVRDLFARLEKVAPPRRPRPAD